jgi:hypothetical protein
VRCSTLLDVRVVVCLGHRRGRHRVVLDGAREAVGPRRHVRQDDVVSLEALAAVRCPEADAQPVDFVSRTELPVEVVPAQDVDRRRFAACGRLVPIPLLGEVLQLGRQLRGQLLATGGHDRPDARAGPLLG